MSNVPQITFLGASVSEFTSSIGWGDNESTLSVTLVEDPLLNQTFSPPAVGQPVTFDANGWVFRGLLQSYRQIHSESSNPIFEVSVVDPRSLLGGVQLILSDYTGGVYGMANLYNVYGYLETALGYGGSQRNDTGIPWRLVVQAFDALQISSNINYRGYSYRLNLASIVPPTDYFRVGGDSISLLDLIDELSNAVACDYFITLSDGGIITINQVRRDTQPTFGYINNTIASLDGVSNKEMGVELRNEPTNKFVVGGNIEYMYIQRYDAGTSNPTAQFEAELNDGWNAITGGFSEDYFDNTIWPYWGKDITGAAIIGEGHVPCASVNFNTFVEQKPISFLQTHQVNLNSVNAFMSNNGIPIVANYMPSYPTDIYEIIAAKAGFEDWQAFLWFIDGPMSKDANNNPILPPGFFHRDKVSNLILETIFNNVLDFKDVTKQAVFDNNVSTVANNNVDPDQDPTNQQLNAEVATVVNILDRQPLLNATLKTIQNNAMNIPRPNEIVHRFLQNVADEFFGKQFMVRIPFVLSKTLPDTNEVITSQEPAQSGFVDESDYATAQQQRIMPIDTTYFQDEDGKLYCYARFTDTANILNLTELPIDSYSHELINSNNANYGSYYWVRCDVEEKLVYDPLGIPRVVIKLPGCIYYDLPPELFNVNTNTYQELFVQGVANALINKLPDGNNVGNKNHPETQRRMRLIAQKYVERRVAGIGGEKLNIGSRFKIPVMPDMVAVPLKNNLLTYGPWYTANVNGKVEYERDPTLVPWNYGGYTFMNYVGQSRVQDALIAQQAGELGSFEYPGMPAVQLGSALVQGGPTVTDISVRIGANGYTTTYHMQTWTPRFGTVKKQYIDKMQRLVQTTRNIRRDLTFQNHTFGNKFASQNTKKVETYLEERNKRFGKGIHSTQLYIGSETHPWKNTDEGLSTKSEVMILPEDHVSDFMNKNYPLKTLATLDSIFRPYNTCFTGDLTESSGIPHFEYPLKSGINNISIYELSPFYNPTLSSGTDIDINKMTYGQSYPSEGLLTDNVGVQDFRGVGLRAPVVLVGWGFDTNGKPVPNSNPDNPGNSFASDFKNRMDLWKVGPLDARWDHTRKVWQAGGTSVKIGRISQNIIGRGSQDDGVVNSGKVKIYEPTSSGVHYTGEEVDVYEWLLPLNKVAYSGQDAIIAQVGGRYFLVGVEPGC